MTKRIIVFKDEAKEDLDYWHKNNQRLFNRIIKLLKNIEDDPFSGIGKPEPLKYMLSGCWSRRIDKEHRLVYSVENNKISILACRYHYS